MIGAMRPCVVIMVFAFLAQVESGYKYQVPTVIQQPIQNWAQAGHILNAQQSVSYSTTQDNFNNFNKNNLHNNFGNNTQKGTVSQNVHHTNPISVQPVQPIITKHIYFHVPPPDEDRLVQPSLTTKRKKTYNIIFIMVPSQNPNYFVNSQGVRSNPYAGVEDKTLIYVLVKKPEDQSQVLSKQSPPNHEVFYVKYKGSATDAASQINNDVPHQHSGQSLRPGLINGL